MGRQSARKVWRRRERERFLNQVGPQVRQLVHPKTHLRLGEQHGPKMSQVLLDFIDPLISGDETLDEYRKVVALGALAWNMALLLSPERAGAIDEAVGTIEPSLDDALREVLQPLIERKLKYFADEARLIADYDVSESAGRRYVQVASLS